MRLDQRGCTLGASMQHSRSEAAGPEGPGAQRGAGPGADARRVQTGAGSGRIRRGRRRSRRAGPSPRSREPETVRWKSAARRLRGPKCGAAAAMAVEESERNKSLEKREKMRGAGID